MPMQRPGLPLACLFEAWDLRVQWGNAVEIWGNSYIDNSILCYHAVGIWCAPQPENIRNAKGANYWQVCNFR
jgi:hypothetical protein